VTLVNSYLLFKGN